MALDAVEFKKRFGKKPIAPIEPKALFDQRMLSLKARYDQGVAQNDPKTMEAKQAIEQHVANGEWLKASDVLEEVESDLTVDRARSDKLKQDLDTQIARYTGNREVEATLDVERKSILAEIHADRLDAAQTALDDFTDTVDAVVADLQKWQDRLAKLDQMAAQMTLRQSTRPAQGDGDKAPWTPEEGLFLQTRHELSTAVSKRDYTLAETKWGAATIAFTAAAKPAAKRADRKEDCENRQAALKHDLDIWLPFVGKNDADVAGIQTDLATLKQHVDNAKDKFDGKEYTKTLTYFDKIAVDLVKLKRTAEKQHTDAYKAVSPFDTLVATAIGNATVPDTVPNTLDLTALEAASKARAAAARKGDWITAMRELTKYAAGFKTIADAIEAQPKLSPKAAIYKNLVDSHPSRKDVMDALNDPTADRAAFLAVPGAKQMLDDMVKDIGAKANTKEKREFIQVAMKARFGLTEVSGGADGKGMSSKALPRMYAVFNMLPPEHTTNNDEILTLQRVKADDTSTAGSTKIVIKAGKTGNPGGNFDNTLLHEIGHGVDMKFSFMATSGKGRAFGGWRDETLDSVKAVAMNDLKFTSDFATVDVDLLKKYMDLVFAGTNPKSIQQQFAAASDANKVSKAILLGHPAVEHAVAGYPAAKADTDDQRDLAIAAKKLVKDKEPMKSIVSGVAESVALGKNVDKAIDDVLALLAFDGDEPDDQTWAAMAVHPAVDFAMSIRLKNGSDGLWDDGDGGAGRCAVNGRVYQEAYTNTWVSYLLSARATKLCNYQFRAKMEWFAESYSAFFRDKLPQSHPMHTWLTTQKQAAPQN